MSRTLEKRAVEQLASVYRCDRCGAEMKPCDGYGITRPGEGASLSAREHQPSGHPTWLPLTPSSVAPHDRYEKANADLCPSCLASLLVWFGPGEEPAQ